MTYVAGFYTEHGIYLTADTALTTDVKDAMNNDTFFGEPAVHDSYSITDEAMKLFKLSSHRIVAAAGEAQEIHKAVQFLRENSAHFIKPIELFTVLQVSLALPNNSVTLVFAQYDESGFEMGIWRSGGEYIRAVNDAGVPVSAICTGSGLVFGYLTKNVAKSIQFISEKTVNNNLAFISCCHQLHGVHSNHVQENVGGAFITAALTKDGITWQPDVTYFRYSPSVMKRIQPEKGKLTLFYPVSVLVREGAVFVERRVPEYRSTFISNALEAKVISDVYGKYAQDLAQKALNLSCEYGAFLSSDEPFALLIHHSTDDYCYKNTIENTVAHITFSEDIYKKLLEKPVLNQKQGAMNIFCMPENFICQQPSEA